MARQAGAPTQIAQHHGERHILTHADDIGAHQAGGRAFVVVESGLDTAAAILVKGSKERLGDILRQFLHDIHEVLDLHGLRSGDQILVVHFVEDDGACFIAEVGQDLAFLAFRYQIPELAAFLGRQRLEQIGGFGGMQLIEFPAQGVVILRLKQGEYPVQTFMFTGFC